MLKIIANIPEYYYTMLVIIEYEIYGGLSAHNLCDKLHIKYELINKKKIIQKKI